MILGKLLLAFIFLTFLVSSLYFIFDERTPSEKYARNSRAFFLLGSILVFASLLLLFFFIYTHQFQYTFVFKYTSRDLPGYFLFSTLWAGQAGTFMMWAFFSSIYGFVLLKHDSKYNNIVLAIIASVIAFLMLLTMKVNPFEYIWVTDPNMFLPGQIPLDGRGLNPLLQDYWMVIHPPILFVGYSSTLVPFAFVIARLIKGQEKDFVSITQPWALFNLVILGTGIILGGYWAYTTLGWGGYWGWDPVENSSLVPWIFMLAYVHGLFVERRKGAFIRTNLVMGAIPFLAMLYGSFLTRSGVLADFSVHSFIDQGINIFLILFILIYLFIFIYYFSINVKRFTGKKLENAFFNQETFFSYAIMIMTVFGILILAGTSSPLLTSFFIDNPANVSIEYYNVIGTSIVVLILVFVGITPYLPWGKGSLGQEKIMFSVSVFLSALITVILVMMNMTKTVSIILIFASLFSLFLNTNLLVTRVQKNFLVTGGFWSHVGISLMVIGIVASNIYDQSFRVAVPENNVETAMGYSFKYHGLQAGERGQDFARLEVSGNNDTFIATPKFYYSEFTRSYMNTPHVENYLTYDVYIAPIQILSDKDVPPGKKVEFIQGEMNKINGLRIKLDRFSMDRSNNSGTIEARAHLKVNYGNKEFDVTPGIHLVNREKKLVPAEIIEHGLVFTLTSLNVNAKQATIYISDKDSTEDRSVNYLVIEVTEKPLILILWIGTVILVMGMSISFINRRKQLLQQ